MSVHEATELATDLNTALCDNCLGISVSTVRFRVCLSFQFPAFPCAPITRPNSIDATDSAPAPVRPEWKRALQEKKTKGTSSNKR